MKYLNLTEGFNPYNAEEKDLIKFESFFFSGGEPHIKLNLSTFPCDGKVVVTSRLTSMNDLGMLLVASDALDQCGLLEDKQLFIPYFFGGRQDRRMVEGEPLTVRVIGDIISKLEFTAVDTFDNHSDVSTALIDNCKDLNNHEFIDYCVNDILKEEGSYENLILISPDAGANKKAVKLAQSIGIHNLVKCDKTRDVTNGNITGFEVYTNNLEGKDCVIVDDICDGGGTFIGLAKELKKKNAGDIYLVVSHGIFSKPLKELQPYFKKIYTTDSWRSEFSWEQVERDCTDLVKIVEFKEFIL